MQSVLLVLFLSWAAQLHAIDPEALLKDMNQAFMDLDYDGVFSYYTGADVTTLRVVHMVVDGEHRERLVHLNGRPREVVRQGDSVVCVLSPDDVSVDLAQSIPSGPFARSFAGTFDRISNHYAVSYAGTDRVAGRAAHRIAVTPKDRDRYGYRVWLDQDNHLLLRSELVDFEGARLEIFLFTEISFGADVSPAALEFPVGEGMHVTRLKFADGGSASPQPAPAHWHTGWIPSGFSMAAADIRHTASKDKPVSTMMYTDGLAAFSVFVEDMPPVGAASLVRRNGATVAVTHTAQGPAGQHALVTLVGEVPETTAQRIAGSIFYGAAP